MSRFDIITIIGHSRKRANRLMTQQVADLPDTEAGRAVADGLEWCAKLELEAEGAEVMQSTERPAAPRIGPHEISPRFSHPSHRLLALVDE